MWENATGGQRLRRSVPGRRADARPASWARRCPARSMLPAAFQIGQLRPGHARRARSVLRHGRDGPLGGGQEVTASTIGGIGQMVGGGLMIIPGAWPWPPAQSISFLSSLLPSLFGGTPQPVNSYGTGGLNYGSGGYTTSGSTYGANAENMDTTGPLGAAGKSIQGIFDLLGGVKDASKAYGIQLASFNQQYADGSSFSNKTSSIINPDGSRKQWGMGSTDADVGLDTASAEVAIESVLNGAVGKITDNMRKALNDLNNAGGPATLEQIQTTVTEVKAFDDALASFGHTTTDAENQIQRSMPASKVSTTRRRNTIWLPVRPSRSIRRRPARSSRRRRSSPTASPTRSPRSPTLSKRRWMRSPRRRPRTSRPMRPISKWSPAMPIRASTSSSSTSYSARRLWTTPTPRPSRPQQDLANAITSSVNTIEDLIHAAHARRRPRQRRPAHAAGRPARDLQRLLRPGDRRPVKRGPDHEGRQRRPGPRRDVAQVQCRATQTTSATARSSWHSSRHCRPRHSAGHRANVGSRRQESPAATARRGEQIDQRQFAARRRHGDGDRPADPLSRQRQPTAA